MIGALQPFVLQVVMSVALFFFGPTALAALCRKASETLAPATTYLQIRLLTLPALILTMVLQARRLTRDACAVAASSPWCCRRRRTAMMHTAAA